MIKSEQQYQNTLDWLQRFEGTVAKLDSDEKLKADDPIRWQLYRDAYQSQVDEFKYEIAEYERLINCDRKQYLQIEVENLTHLPWVLIKARMAAKISQEELAETLGISSQRVKEYEDTDYQCASFVELLEVSTALGVEVEKAVMRVDFEEIEEAARIAKKWQERKKKKAMAAPR
ncbi:MAG: helix-turn-helix transcriptional regulator [Hormoscilla sp. GUM202]|nr:helix-turn-helix transcriptional regulator [Hormoscilla sp. GUM202]